MFIITHRRFFYILSAILIALSIGSMVFYGFNIGIDFAGGTITEVSYSVRPDKTAVEASLANAGFDSVLVQPVGTDRYAVRMKELSETQKPGLIRALSLDGASPATEQRSSSIGPTVGSELKQKAYVAVALVVLLIVLFITFAFRKVSEPVASWKFGIATIIALAHDVVIPAGVFAAFSHFFGGQVDMLFVSALLAILGFSVHDTIVVFDRVRENLRVNRERHNREEFSTTVGKSVSETYGRSINTSLTIFIVLLALYIFGPDTTREFTFTLIVGIIVGTYSSICIASPLLVTFESMQSKKAKK